MCIRPGATVTRRLIADLGRGDRQPQVAARSAAKAEECAAELGGEAVPYDLDLGSLASVRAFVAAAAEELGPLDVLIANAGIGQVPGRQKTADGHEIAWGTNHLGHFALVQVSRGGRRAWKRREVGGGGGGVEH